MIDEAKALLLALTGQFQTLTIPRLLALFMGSLEGGLFLNQLIFWSGRGKRADGFIYKTAQEWEEELLLTTYAVRKNTQILKDRGLLETKLLKVNGAPTVHYRLILDALVIALIDFAKSKNVNFDFAKIVSAKSKNANCEIAKTEIAKSQKPGNCEIAKSITENNHNSTTEEKDTTEKNTTKNAADVAVVHPEFDTAIFAQLQDFGIWEASAKKHARTYAGQMDKIERVLSHAKSANNPGAAANAMLERGEIPAEILQQKSRHQQYEVPEWMQREDDNDEILQDEPRVSQEVVAIWNAAKDELKLQMDRATYMRWIHATWVDENTENVWKIGCNTIYIQDWLNHRLRRVIERTMTRLIGGPVEIEFVVGEDV